MWLFMDIVVAYIKMSLLLSLGIITSVRDLWERDTRREPSL
jgi:hypothetical protein